MIRSHQVMLAASGTMRSLSEAHLQQLLKRQALRRLFKARHQEMDHLEIRTRTLCASCTNDPSTPRFTVYSLQIQSTLRYGDCGTWILTKRYSEFFRFRQQLLHQIQAFDSLRTTQVDAAKHQREWEVVSNCLRRCLSNDFPRKHLRCDTHKIVLERRRGLQDFVRKLLETYVDLSVYLVERPLENDAMQGLQTIFKALEEFLDFPPEQKDLEKRHTAAILALQEVDDVVADDHQPLTTPDDLHARERMCCICLDDLDDNNDHHDNHDNDNEEVGPEAAGDSCSNANSQQNHLVKLPCGHHFHEDCVIDWFTASTTCPLCRQAVISSQETMSSFDVSFH